jgi:precorrin-4 methylase
MLQVIRLREQVAGTQALARHANSQVEQAQNLARYTLWMAVFVGLASIAQVATVLVAIFALP